MKFDSSQLHAIERACTTPFSIITGGAGAGKTTIIREITTRLEAAGEEVLLMAFAGKAAARMREACQHPASTIHRALGYNGKAFLCGDLSAHTVIVDESSMVDSQLMAEIMQRKPKRLILVGDQAQLPPVGRGAPFHDAIKCFPQYVSNLTTCYRNREAVFQAASMIRSGARPPEQLTSDGESWNMTNTGNAQRTQEKILEWIADGAFDFESDILLVCRNGDSEDEPCTVRGLNKAISQMLRPRGEKEKFKVGDRVVNTKNIPELDFWNGSTGTISNIDIDGGIWIRSDIPVQSKSNPGAYTDHVLFTREHKGHLQLAYCLTTHKSQGSSYGKVVFAGFNRDLHAILDRSLLYTAVTRTREVCIVCGELSAAYAAVDRVSRKRTIIQQLSEGA